MSPLIIPIFISHAGCPHRCLFCDQEKITSHSAHLTEPQDVRESLEKALNTRGFYSRPNREAAFYGGTFTNLKKAHMESLLKAAAPYLESGAIQSIRISTRPDALDAERLKMLKAYGVATVELGVQSMDDRVLALSQRGHSTRDTWEAVRMLKEYGFNTGVQLMPGLPGDSETITLVTAKKIVDLRPHMVRIYPALVIKGTKMAKLYETGAYQPFSLENAVRVCAKIVNLFERNGIPVIRLGLMSSPSFDQKNHILAGPWHPAFGFLVRSTVHLSNIVSGLPILGATSRIRIYSPSREIPLVRGYENHGVRKIEQITGASVMDVLPDDTVPPGKIRWESS